MEFARRGRATDGVVDGGHRSLYPSPHVDPMSVIRDALLSQLQMDRLRQEVILAELANIERAMDLRHASRHGIAANDVEWSKPVPFTFSEESMLHCPSSVDPELKKRDERLSSVGLESRKPPMEDRVTECVRPCCCKAEAGQEDVKIEEEKLQESTEIIQLQNTSPLEKWELTEITIPVKKPRQKLSCDVCQVQTTSEHTFKEHCAGRKHRSNLATLESNKAITQKAQTAEEPSSCKGQKTAEEPSSCKGQKTSSTKWGCITCHVSGTMETDSNDSLNGRTHQLNIETQHMKGDGMGKNVGLQEAEDHKSNAPQHAEKPPICSICQDSCARELELVEHLWAKIQSLLDEISNIARNSESQEAPVPPNVVPQHAQQVSRSDSSIFQADSDYQSELENQSGGKIQQLDFQALHQEAKKMGKNPPKIANSQKPPSAWDGSICQAKCNSESQFDDPLSGSKHQKNIEALQGEGENAKSSDLIAKNKVRANGCDRNSAISEMEVQSSICQAKCNSESQLDDPLGGSKHQKNIEALQGEGENAKSSDLTAKSKVRANGCDRNSAISEKMEEQSSICQAKCNSESQFDDPLGGSKHQKNIEAPQGQGGIVKSSDLIVENKVRPNGCDRNSATSEKMEKQAALYFCEVCNLQCNSSCMLADHCKGEAHREKQKLRNFCKVCNLQCNSEKMIVQHRSGNKHQKKLHASAKKWNAVGWVYDCQ